MPERHFVKYTFLRVDPAWRRLDAAQRARDKQAVSYTHLTLPTKA